MAINSATMNFILTDDLKEQKYTRGRMSGHLALVHSGIPRLDVFYLKRPVLAVVEVNRLKPLVIGVRRQSYGQ